MVGIAESKNSVAIRLTDERWFHIVENHNELAGLADKVLETISGPDFIVGGLRGELLAVKKIKERFLVTVYKEERKDGFVITAFLARKITGLKKRKIIWSK